MVTTFMAGSTGQTAELSEMTDLVASNIGSPHICKDVGRHDDGSRGEFKFTQHVNFTR